MSTKVLLSKWSSHLTSSVVLGLHCELYQKIRRRTQQILPVMYFRQLYLCMADLYRNTKIYLIDDREFEVKISIKIKKL